ncbi:hypothetical protein WMY93_021614 [Mugilogobius chulae]|uniref:Ciliary microtubule inner protein 2B n=1 Tax=Mugilogobius chulae TaxID=88201 RepID=A0AAW0NMF4_9GOBI
MRAHGGMRRMSFGPDSIYIPQVNVDSSGTVRYADPDLCLFLLHRHRTDAAPEPSANPSPVSSYLRGAWPLSPRREEREERKCAVSSVCLCARPARGLFVFDCVATRVEELQRVWRRVEKRKAHGTDTMIDDATYTPDISKVLFTRTRTTSRVSVKYAGYCPQLKYHIGKPYGQLTSELLTDPHIKHSPRLMLSGLSRSDEAARSGIGRGIPDCHVRRIMPGYTGFIPKSQSHFACSYGEMCRRALTDFYQEQQRRSQQPSSAKLPQIHSHGGGRQSPGPELQTVASTHGRKHPGFTGHVPKARYLIGKGYPITTNEALIQFGKQQRHEPLSQDTAAAQDCSAPSSYRPNRAVVPYFTGHIPGYRFLYGQTFGQLSQNALEKSGSKRVAWVEC